MIFELSCVWCLAFFDHYAFFVVDWEEGMEAGGGVDGQTPPKLKNSACDLSSLGDASNHCRSDSIPFLGIASFSYSKGEKRGVGRLVVARRINFPLVFGSKFRGPD